jgi:hypothetical protein
MGADHREFLDATIPYLDAVWQAAGDGQDPEDLVQETYLRAYAGFGSFRGGSTRAWRLGSTEAVVAVSGQPFPMPAGAQGIAGRGMAWSARLGQVGLYCLNGGTSELVAAPIPATELAALAARLPLA